MKMHTIAVLSALGLVAVVTAIPRNPQKIVGGSTTTISQYPNMAALLATWDFSTYIHGCGGVIINNRSILTAAHCPYGDAVNVWRIRVGSTFAHSGGTVYNVQSIIVHPSFNVGAQWNNDIAIMHTATAITFVNNAVQPASIAGPNYNLVDNAIVWATGWGDTSFTGSPSEILRHVQIWVVNQDTCVERYRSIGDTVTDNMLCAGWLDVGGRDQCHGDSGGPLYHNGVVVGICSWGEECALARYPGVNVRVSRYTSWILDNA